MNKFLIGIDPGINNGVAAWDVNNKKLATLQTLGISELYNYLSNLNQYLFFEVIIENPNLNKPVFAKTLSGAKGNAALKIAQNVGQNKGIASCIIAYCKHLGIKYTEIKPTNSKVQLDYFKKLTNWKGACSQHAIDAAMLVYGR